MEYFRPVRGFGLAASVLIGLVAIVQVGEVASDWNVYLAVRDYRAGEATIPDIIAADRINGYFGAPQVATQLLAATVFIVWMYRARINAERLTFAAEHRYKRPWVIFGWFVPFVNLAFPKQIIDDIWRASDPLQQTVPLQQRARVKLTTFWWTGYLVWLIAGNFYFAHYVNGQPATSSYLTAVAFSATSAVGGLVTALLGVQVVQRISDRQSTPYIAPQEDPQGISALEK